MITKFGVFESDADLSNEVISYLSKKMFEDKSEYKGDIKTKYNPGSPWKTNSWIVDEIMQFLKLDFTSSYTLMKFGKKYSYDNLKKILKDNFHSQYEKALEKLYH